MIIWGTTIPLIVYLIWAIHRYNSNYGLSDHEWKILYPGIYAKKDERKDFIDLRDKMVTDRQKNAALKSASEDDTEVITTPFEEPEENPYKTDSFGLPPNTIRGIIALTALFLFILMEGINFFSSIPIEDNFSELILALQMVIAFYFGYQ